MKSRNEVSDDQLTLFDMFDILNSLTDIRERQILVRLQERHQFSFGGGPLLPELTEDLTLIDIQFVVFSLSQGMALSMKLRVFVSNLANQI